VVPSPTKNVVVDVLPPEFSEGTIVAGKYLITGCLGSGGMGVVASARHVALGSRVALKIMKTDLASDPKACARFTREARLAASIEGEHCARIFDVGTVTSDALNIEIPYIAMEQLSGEGLDNLLARDGALPVADVMYIMFQVFCALAEAHSRDLVHRDIKPANLFVVARPGDPLFIKVLDFGISKALAPDTEFPLSITVTAPNTIMGSPEYMSPEQLQDSPALDARADVWACGIVMFELLTRSMPFAAKSLAELYANVLRTRPRDLEAVAPQPLPAGLSAAWARCLEKSAQLRYQSVAELASALAPFADDRARALLPQILAWGGDTSTAPPLSRNLVPPGRLGVALSTDRISRLPRTVYVVALFGVAGLLAWAASGAVKRSAPRRNAGAVAATTTASVLDVTRGDALVPPNGQVTVQSGAGATGAGQGLSGTSTAGGLSTGSTLVSKAPDKRMLNPSASGATPPWSQPRTEKSARTRIQNLGNVEPVD
jgi:eukaryotic-like serine/threonine-protein kinase